MSGYFLHFTDEEKKSLRELYQLAPAHRISSRRGDMKPGPSAFRAGVLSNHLPEVGRKSEVLVTVLMPSILTEAQLLNGAHLYRPSVLAQPSGSFCVLPML